MNEVQTPTLHITLGPRHVWKTEHDDTARWCFAERKRHGGTWTLLGDGPPGTPSWYEPVWRYECDGCGRDSREFGSGRW